MINTQHWNWPSGLASHPASVPKTEVTLDELEDEITTLCAHIGAAEYRLLRAIGEFDAREGWSGFGLRSCAHWLNWKCGISMPAAHERVRVARALKELSAIGAAMGRGQLSYSKVRALTRVATADNEATLVRMALEATAHQVEELVRRYRSTRRLEEVEKAARRQREREVRYRWDDDGTLVLHARLPAEQGALVLQALEAAAESLRRAEHDEPTTESWNKNSSAEDSAEHGGLDTGGHAAVDCFSARRADALTLMAETLLERGAEGLSPGERHQVVVHVDAQSLTDESHDGGAHVEDGPPLAVETVRRLLCDGSIVPVVEDVEDADGAPLSVGRKTRAIPPALRRALKSRDRGCRFPGCTNCRYVDGHHIRHWADGGETSLDNLVLLCRTPHRLVHEEGFGVKHEGSGLSFHMPDGRRLDVTNSWRAIPYDPVLALVQANTGLGIDARTCRPPFVLGAPDYSAAVGAL